MVFPSDQRMGASGVKAGVGRRAVASGADEPLQSGDDVLVLSRFAFMRRRGTDMVIESPRAGTTSSGNGSSGTNGANGNGTNSGTQNADEGGGGGGVAIGGFSGGGAAATASGAEKSRAQLNQLGARCVDVLRRPHRYILRKWHDLSYADACHLVVTRWPSIARRYGLERYGLSSR